MFRLVYYFCNSQLRSNYFFTVYRLTYFQVFLINMDRKRWNTEKFTNANYNFNIIFHRFLIDREDKK